MNADLQKLFFEPHTRLSKEINNYYELNEFHNILVEKCNFCNDDNLDVKRLQKLYNKYVEVFITNKGNFKNYFLGQIKCKRFILKPYAVFGESLWKRTKSSTSLEFFLNLGYNIECAQKILKDRQTLTSPESFQKRYGDDWENHFNEYVKKHNESLISNPNIDEINKKKSSYISYKYYLTKINPDTNQLYTEDEAKKIISQKRSISSEKSAIQRRGKTGVTGRSIQYWINKGYSEEDAKNKVKEIQSTNNIETYIKKYGEQDGIQKWIERNKKWGEKMQIKKMESGHIGSAYSNASKLFFDNIVSKLKENNIYFEKIYYGEKEFSKWDKENKRVYFYDFVIPEVNLCVEYNGLKFHPKEGDVNWVGLFGNTYEYKIQYDKRKLDIIKSCGYKTIVVWEDDDLEEKINYIVSLCK